MLKLIKTTGAVVASLASVAFLASNVVQAGAVHVQEAEMQLLESAGLETVVIDGEVGHVF